MPVPVTTVFAQVPTVLIGLPFVLLCWASTPLLGQQATTDSLERGDRVRVWSSEDQGEGRELDVREWAGDTLVLMEPDAIGVSRLSLTEIEKLRLQRATGGNNMLEGALIGAAVGIIPSAVLASRFCSGPDSGCGPMGAFAFTFGPAALYGIVPAGLVGGAIGLGISEHEWVSVDLGPAAEIERGAGNMGVSIRVRFQAPQFP